MKLAAKLSTSVALMILIVMFLPVPVTAYQPPPPLPMLLNGFVYVNGVKAEDGTLVEARINGVTVASCRTETFEGQKGRYALPPFQGSPDDEVHLFVEGKEANESPVAYEIGRQTLDLTVGVPKPVTYTLTMVVMGSGQTIPPVGAHAQLEGSMVDIRAIPDEGWKFYGWIGDVADPNSAATWIIMDGDKTVTAKFMVPTPTPTATSTATPPGPTATATATSETPTSPTATPTATPPGPTVAATATSEVPAPGPTVAAAVTSEQPAPGPIAATATSEVPAPSPTATATTASEQLAPGPIATSAATSTEGRSGGNRTWLLIAVGLTGIAGIALGVLLRKLGAKGP